MTDVTAAAMARSATAAAAMMTLAACGGSQATDAGPHAAVRATTRTAAQGAGDERPRASSRTAQRARRRASGCFHRPAKPCRRTVGPRRCCVHACEHGSPVRRQQVPSARASRASGDRRPVSRGQARRRPRLRPASARSEAPIPARWPYGRDLHRMSTARAVGKHRRWAARHVLVGIRADPLTPLCTA
jgi:hypothetical protein